MKNKIGKMAEGLVANIKMTLYVIALAAILVGVIWVLDKCSDDDGAKKEIVIEDTPITIEDVRPVGELYVCSSIIEDYEVMHKTEKTLGIISTEHTCAQMMRMKCSYVINLDKIKYKEIDGKKLLVKLPKLEYMATVIDTPFMSDDEAYWAKALPSTNNMKKKVERKIKRQFETEENKNKGERYAEDAVRNLLENLGFEVEFVSTLRGGKKGGK